MILDRTKYFSRGSGLTLAALWLGFFAILSSPGMARAGGSANPTCPANTIIRPGRHADLLHGYDNYTTDTLYVCFHIGGERWPPFTEVLDYSPVFPGTSVQLLGRLAVPDTAAAGTNVITWFAGCSNRFAPACSYVITIPELISAPHAEASATLARATWTVADSSADTATVYRRSGSGGWASRGEVHGSVGGELQFTDRTVVPGTSYTYRLGFPVENRQIYRGDVAANVPDLVSGGSAHVEAGRVQLQWTAIDSAAFAATVYRRASSGQWVRLSAIAAMGAGELLYEDRSVTPGESYTYRLGVAANDTTFFRGDISAIAAIDADDLSLQVLGANPAVAMSLVAVTLGRSDPARLEVMDAAGRLAASQSLPSAPGRYVLNVAGGSNLRAGVYFLRLRQGNRQRLTRVAILR